MILLGTPGVIKVKARTLQQGLPAATFSTRGTLSSNTWQEVNCPGLWLLEQQGLQLPHMSL